MKIGLLTLSLKENYGGILQCVALYSYLANQGHDVVLLYKDKEIPMLKSAIKKVLSAIPFYDFRNIKSNRKKMLLHLPFINSCIPNISDHLKTSDDLAAAVKKYKLDAVIVGSDQVWRLQYINDKHYKSFFLDFVGNDVKKIAYAASFGKNCWEGKGDEAEIGSLLDRFDFISVREKSGIDICKNTFGVKNEVHHVLDPTMLWPKDFYMNLMPSYSFNKKISLMTYVLDEAEAKAKIISSCIQKRDIPAENILHLKGFGDSNRFYTVPEWLEAFAKADFIITDSFHGAVFSIIFNKQFVAIANKNRGLDRFISLLSMFNLQDRIIYENDANMKSYDSEINYGVINSIMADKRKKSLDLLESL